MLPALNAVMARSDNKTQVRFYEGIEGIKACHEVLLAKFTHGNVKEYSEIIVTAMSANLFKEGDSPARDEARKKIIKNHIKAKPLTYCWGISEEFL